MTSIYYFLDEISLKYQYADILNTYQILFEKNSYLLFLKKNIIPTLLLGIFVLEDDIYYPHSLLHFSFCYDNDWSLIYIYDTVRYRSFSPCPYSLDQFVIVTFNVPFSTYLCNTSRIFLFFQLSVGFLLHSLFVGLSCALQPKSHSTYFFLIPI